MILVDTNILIYARGADHVHKEPSVDLLRRVASGAVEAAIDAELLQELLHRYRSIGRWEAGVKAYEQARRVFETVYPVTADDTVEALALMAAIPSLRARDAIHAAIALRHCDGVICSYDTDFDGVPAIRRLKPADV